MQQVLINDLNKKARDLIERCEKTQRITTLFQNQLISVKNLRDDLGEFIKICRLSIVSLLNLQQNSDLLTYDELEMLTVYSNMHISNKDSVRIILNLLKQIIQYQCQISALNELLIKSVLPKIERANEIEYSLRLPSSIFEETKSIYDLFIYEINKQKIYIRSIREQIKQNDIEIVLIDIPKHHLAEINYNSSEKYSFIYDIEFQRVITSMDQLTIAIPCFFQLENQTKQISIRCKRLMEPLIHIPALIEIYNEISYAVFRLTYSLSSISVEAVLDYPFEILHESIEDLSSIYTTESHPNFRMKTPKNYFLRLPRVRMIPLNNDLIRFLQRDEQLIACSDLIEFDYYKENTIEEKISLTISLTRFFHSNYQINEDLQNRMRKAQKKLLLQREKFEQEKYDEAGGSLAATPSSNYGLTSPTVMSHLPSIAAILERMTIDQRESRTKLSFHSVKTSMKWNFQRFENAHAPMILLGYKNRKWKNCNNFIEISPSNEKDTYIIHCTTFFDRLILIRCWSETSNEGKLAEYLWSLTSMKLFSCVLARDQLAHYALVIVPIEKERLAEDILRKRDYTELIFNENRSSFEQTNKYVQFCLSEGSYVRIVPRGNIDLHEKVDLNFRLYAQHPYILEFDIYPIDVYRQKTDKDFIGSLNLYPSTMGSTSNLVIGVSSRTSSSESKELNLSIRTSISGTESFNNTSVRDFNETNLICSIRIHLSKSLSNISSKQSNTTISISIPKYFTDILEYLTDNKQEFIQALHIHPSLINSLDCSQNDETLFKWFKRQHTFQPNEIIEKLTSALIQIGRIDLAYCFKIDFLKNKMN